MAASVSRFTLIKAAILLAAFAFAYSTPMALLVKEWRSPDFSHGVLVPFVSLYFIWAERRRLKNIPVQPDYIAGIALILGAALVLVVGKAGRVQVAQEASILLIIPGLIALILGRRYLRALTFPIAYLAFMVPLINPFLDRINWPFQIFTAKFAAFFLTYIGVPVYQKMQFLELSNISLEVAPGCSGIKFMISVFATAVPLAYFTQRGWLRKATLLILAFIIGLFTNGLRVTLIGVWTHFHLGDTTHGPYHLLQGYFVAIMGFILLFSSAMVLSKLGGGVSPEVKKEESFRTNNGHSRSTNVSFIAALVFLSGMGWYTHFFNPVPVPLNLPLNGLPLSIGDWKGKDMGNDESPARAPGAQAELTRLYSKSSGREALLYIGYFDSQMEGDGLVNDYFGDFNEGVEEAEVPDIRGSIRVNKKIMIAGKREYLVLFWYDLNGRTFTDMHSVKLETAYDSLVHGRTNGSVIMVISELKGRGELEDTLHDEANLVQALHPVLKSFFTAGNNEAVAGGFQFLKHRKMM